MNIITKIFKPLGAGEKVTLEIDEIYHGAVRAFPSEIKQADNQLVVVEVRNYIKIFNTSAP